MSKLFIVSILSLFPIISVADSVMPVDCKLQVEKVVRALLKLEHDEEIENCGDQKWSHCLKIESSNQKDKSGNSIYYATYTFGGFYSNVDDYTVSVNLSCEPMNISISRD